MNISSGWKYWAWVLPGMGIKRWLTMTACGILAINAAVGLWVYQMMRQPLVHSLLAWVCLALGLIGVAVGISRIMAAVVAVLRPDADLLEALYLNRSRNRGPKLVAIGGGTGLSTLLRGLKVYSNNITAIVTVADDGGSSGRLRTELGVLPPGDIRNCLTALAGEERLLTDLFRFRFPGESTLGGHAFGNLFLAAMVGVTGDLMNAIRSASRVLAVRGEVLPATMTQMTLVASYEDGSEVKGESQITAQKGRITNLWCEPHRPDVLPEAVRAIEEADAIIIGPGSLYTSLVPHLLIPGLRLALERAKAPVIYVCNVMTQTGESDHLSACDHLAVLQRFGGKTFIDSMLVNDVMPSRLLNHYSTQGQFPVAVDEERLATMGVELVKGALIDEAESVRHHPARLAAAIMQWFGVRLPKHYAAIRPNQREFANPLGGET